MAKIAYLILTHGQPYQTIDFLWSIWRAGDAYFVHVDRKSPETAHAALAALATEFPNINIVPPDVCTWGGFTLIEAEWRCLLAALDNDSEWSHAALVSGAHLPLRSPEALAASLETGHSYLDFHKLALDAADADLPHTWDQRAERLTFKYVEVPGIGIMRGLAQSPPPGVAFYVGSQWWVLSRQAAELVCAARNTALADFFRSTLVPDEICFSTILLNSPLKDQIVGRNTVWQRWKNGRPCVLTEQDLAAARASDAFFARKASDATMRDHTGILGTAVSASDRRKWVRSVMRAFDNYMPAAMRDEAVERYRFGGESREDEWTKERFATRATIAEISRLISRCANEAGIRAEFYETASEEKRPILVARFPDLRTKATYLLVTRTNDRGIVWVGLHLHADETGKASEELAFFPEPVMLDFSFPLAGALHPHHDFLSLEMKRKGLIRLDAPSAARDLEEAIRSYLDVLVRIAEFGKRGMEVKRSEETRLNRRSVTGKAHMAQSQEDASIDQRKPHSLKRKAQQLDSDLAL